MEKDSTEPNPSHQRNGVSDVLYGEFMDILNENVRYSVSLTESDLTVQKITSSPGWSMVTFNLRDCIGCRAFKGDDNADVGAYFSAYFYPFKGKWMSSGLARQRVEQCFRVAPVQDSVANLQEAERWARAIREASVRQLPRRVGGVYSEVRRPCRVMLLLNPISGKGQALSLFKGHVQRMLTEAAVPYTLVITEHKNHARELVRDADLSQCDALVIMSGDGLLFEVVNGLMEREDWETAIQTPLGILPGGSGNAVAASVNHYSESPPVWSEELLVSCGFLLCKGLVSRLDLVSVGLASGQRLFSFLSLVWGFVADVDIESERYRYAGAVRFIVGMLVRLVSLRVYQGRLAFLPAQGPARSAEPPPTAHTLRGSSLCSSLPSLPTANASPVLNSLHNRNACANRNAFPNANTRPNPFHKSSTSPVTNRRSEFRPSAVGGPPDSLLPRLGQPVPVGWTVVEEENFVLVLAINQSHLAEDLLTAPGATAEDGIIHLFYIRAGISRPALLRTLMAMQKGEHLSSGCPYLVYERVQALRLEPLSPQGVITVDGEAVEYGPVQAQIHRGLARLITG